ncbi:MAG: carbohydrate kinase [Planctomycetia bacterium]|nr:carbohydrate kinase [Planctomycetia bacterium]
MTPARFDDLTARYASLRIALVGDFCLDRYLEIDPAREELSIETGRAVHNVVRVRSQPGGAGTILNNLAALGIGRIHAIGFSGDDGEGFELRRALAERRTPDGRACVDLTHFRTSTARRTFTYCKPLVVEAGRDPVELNRLDSKNWTPTPRDLEDALIDAVASLRDEVDAVILLDQVDVPETGVVTQRVREAVAETFASRPEIVVLADSRRGLSEFPKLGFKMNAAELHRMSEVRLDTNAADLDAVRAAGAALAQANGKPVFVTLAERGIVGALPNHDVSGGAAVEHVPALPVRGAIDVVGAGDSVTANLSAALAAGSTIREALELAMAGASLVVHQLGTTGTANVAELRALLFR